MFQSGAFPEQRASHAVSHIELPVHPGIFSYLEGAVHDSGRIGRQFYFHPLDIVGGDVVVLHYQAQGGLGAGDGAAAAGVFLEHGLAKLKPLSQVTGNCVRVIIVIGEEAEKAQISLQEICVSLISF